MELSIAIDGVSYHIMKHSKADAFDERPGGEAKWTKIPLVDHATTAQNSHFSWMVGLPVGYPVSAALKRFSM